MNQYAVRILAGLLREDDYFPYNEVASLTKWFGEPHKGMTVTEVKERVAKYIQDIQETDTTEDLSSLSEDLINFVTYFYNCGGQLGFLFTMLIIYGDEECFTEAERLLIAYYDYVSKQTKLNISCPEDIYVDH